MKTSTRDLEKEIKKGFSCEGRLMDGLTFRIFERTEEEVKDELYKLSREGQIYSRGKIVKVG